MKKLILLTVFAGVVFSCIAQDSSTRITPIQSNALNAFTYKQYRFSVSATPLLGWLSPDSKNITNEGSRLGIGGGITLEKNFTENVAFCFGLHVNQMGGKLKYDSLWVKNASGGNNNVVYTYKTRYVEVPALIKLRTDEFGYNRIYFEAGLALGFLWRGRADLDKLIFTNAQGGNEDRIINENDEDFDATRSSANEDNVYAIRIPLLVGAGWEYALSKNTVAFAGLRYSAGLNNTMTAENTKAFNNFIGLNIGVLF